MLRLFNSGHREEERFIRELKSIGAEIYDKDEETGGQINFKEFGGHFAGSCDGIARGTPEGPKSWAICEFKTHSAKSFTKLEEEGVKKSKPMHYAQMQVYMGKFELDRALYLACNKDTDALYSEWIYFEKHTYEALLKKAHSIVFAASPPVGISENPEAFGCKFCDHKSVCHEKIVPGANCRTCARSTPDIDGSWRCDLTKKILSVEDQRLGCSDHLYIPDLLGFAVALDYQDTYVFYEAKTKDGTISFANATRAGKERAMKESPRFAIYESKELERAGPEIVGHKIINQVKIELQGTMRVEKNGA